MHPTTNRVSHKCKIGDHGWCMNTTPEETHCKCSCHEARTLQHHAMRLREIAGHLEERAARILLNLKHRGDIK